MTPELHTYRNKDGGLIVLYSSDDKDACHVSDWATPLLRHLSTPLFPK